MENRLENGYQRRNGSPRLFIPFILGAAHVLIIGGYMPSADIGTSWQQATSSHDIITSFLIFAGITCLVFHDIDDSNYGTSYAQYLSITNHDTFTTNGWLGTGAIIAHLYQWYFFTRSEGSFEKLLNAFGSTIQYQITETRFHLVNDVGPSTNTFDYPFADVVRSPTITPQTPSEVAATTELEIPTFLRLVCFVVSLLIRRQAVMRALTPKQLEFAHTLTTAFDNCFYLTLDLFVLRHTGRVVTYPLGFSVVHSSCLIATLWSGLLRAPVVYLQIGLRLVTVVAVPLRTGCWRVLLHPSSLVQTLTLVYLVLRTQWCDGKQRRNFEKYAAIQRRLLGGSASRDEASIRRDG